MKRAPANLAAVRARDSRRASRSAAVIDSQSAETTEEGGPHGDNGAKKLAGRKRQVLVDTAGLLMGVVVHAADVADRDGARRRLDGIKRRYARQQQLERYGLTDPLPERGFRVIPRRWVVERSLAWLGRNRRLSKDYKRLPSTEEVLVYLASIRLLLRRLSKRSTGPVTPAA